MITQSAILLLSLMISCQSENILSLCTVAACALTKFSLGKSLGSATPT